MASVEAVLLLFPSRATPAAQVGASSASGFAHLSVAAPSFARLISSPPATPALRHAPKHPPRQMALHHQEPAMAGTGPNTFPVAVLPTLVSAPARCSRNGSSVPSAHAAAPPHQSVAALLQATPPGIHPFPGRDRRWSALWRARTQRGGPVSGCRTPRQYCWPNCGRARAGSGR